VGHIIWELFVHVLPWPAQVVLWVVGTLVFLCAYLSVAWTTWKTRAILRRALGRSVQSGEVTSLRMWMALSDTQLDAAVRELKRNPFELTRD